MAENEVDDLQPDESPDGEVPESTEKSEEPDYKTLYEEASDSSRAVIDALKSQQAANEARMQQLEGLLGAIASGKNAPPIEEEPIDPEDPTAIYKFADRMVEKKLQERDRFHEQRYRSLAARQLQEERADYERREPHIVKRFKNEIEVYYRNKPEEQFRPGSFSDLMKYLKGQHFDELVEDYKKRPKVPLSPSPTSPTGPSSPRAENKELSLDPEAERIANIYRRMSGKPPITPEEYYEIKGNRDKYPGKRPRGGK